MGRKRKESKLVYLSNPKQADILADMLKEQISLKTDLVIYCSGGQVEAHSFILAQKSDVFRIALDGFPKGFEYAVSMPGIRMEMAKCLITFIYTGSLVLLGKYVEPFNAILEELKIVVDVEKVETEADETDVSIFAPLVENEEDDHSDDDFQYFVDAPLETPKKRKSIKIGGRQGRPKKKMHSGSGPQTAESESVKTPVEPTGEKEQSETAVSDVQTVYSQDVQVIVGKDGDDHGEENVEDGVEELSFMSGYFSNGDGEKVRVVSTHEEAAPAREEIVTNEIAEEPRKMETRKKSISFKVEGDEMDDDSDPEFSAREMTIDSEEENEKETKKLKVRKKLREKALPKKRSEGADGRQHSCSICKIDFRDKKKLKEHYATHKKGDFYFCSICSQRFRAFSVLAVHNRKHTGEKPFKCPYCEREFAHQASYDTHVNIHTGEKPYACKECGKGFHNRAALYAHNCDEPLPDDADPLRYECAECHRRFKSRVALGRHKSAHRDSQSFVEKSVLCELCGRGFSSVHLLRQHLKYHSDSRPYSCSVCGKGFFARTTMENHQKSHSESDLQFVCGVCKKVFKTPEVLDRHHRMVHTDERGFACDICTETFRLRSQLDNHMLLHTNNVKYQCHCGKLFLNPKYLHKHKLTHIKVIRCMFCRKAFTTAEERDDHEQLHRDGTLPVTKNNAAAKSLKSQYYNCSECNERFKSREELNDHVGVHRLEAKADGTVNGEVEEEYDGDTSSYEVVQGEATEEQVFYGEQVVVVSADNAVPGQPPWGLHYVVIAEGSAEPTQVVTFGS